MNGGPSGPAALTVEESISLSYVSLPPFHFLLCQAELTRSLETRNSLQNVVLKATLKDSGTFMVYDGTVMAW